MRHENEKSEVAEQELPAARAAMEIDPEAYGGFVSPLGDGEIKTLTCTLDLKVWDERGALLVYLSGDGERLRVAVYAAEDGSHRPSEEHEEGVRLERLRVGSVVQATFTVSSSGRLFILTAEITEGGCTAEARVPTKADLAVEEASRRQQPREGNAERASEENGEADEKATPGPAHSEKAHSEKAQGQDAVPICTGFTADGGRAIQGQDLLCLPGGKPRRVMWDASQARWRHGSAFLSEALAQSDGRARIVER